MIPEKFYFLRHGESINNKNGLVNGWTDCALTIKGLQQAKKAAQVLKNYKIERIVTSDLIRAIETAKEVAKMHEKLKVETFKGLRERNWGEYENKSRETLPNLFINPSQGESWIEYYQRVENTLSNINLNENVLIVGHAGTMRVLNIILGHGDKSSRIPNSTPIEINLRNQNPLNFLK